MERKVFKIASSIFSPLGLGSLCNLEQMQKGVTGLQIIKGEPGWPEQYCASAIDPENFACIVDKYSLKEYSRFDAMMLVAAIDAIGASGINPSSKDVCFILSTTKGNIDYLDTDPHNKDLYMWESAKLLGRYFGNPNPVRLVSQACISSLAATILASDLIMTGRCKYAVIVGADILSRFTVSGFQCLRALSAKPCKPFDKERCGLNLGEASVCLVLGCDKPKGDAVKIGPGGTSNDAHHISAPSRTAEGLTALVESCMRKYGREVDFINTHGTATLFNDQMEALAMERTGLNHIPLMSFKAWFGHTLGASGLLDLVLCILSLEQNLLIPSRGFDSLGVPSQINVQREWERRPLRSCLKTASGFGGCNGAVVLEKILDNE